MVAESKWRSHDFCTVSPSSVRSLHFFEGIEICKVKDVFHFKVSYYEPKFTSKRDLQIESSKFLMFKNAGLLLDNKSLRLVMVKNYIFLTVPL